MTPIVINGRDFASLRGAIKTKFLIDAKRVHPAHWQGLDVSNKPEMLSHELMNVTVSTSMPTDHLHYYRDDIAPNLPWADDHFAERVGGEPLNPGEEWARWPWAKSADRFREGEQKIFNHTYMERLWPRYARRTPGGRLPDSNGLRKTPHIEDHDNAGYMLDPRSGIGWQYGDLEELVALLVHDPLTRQAYIPLFFPEDTGYGDGGRKPCTLGYHFIMREDRLHLYYPIRSCDYIRHYSDDCYLAVRLLLWVLDNCRMRDPTWKKVMPGQYTMWCGSLHIFANDMRML